VSQLRAELVKLRTTRTTLGMLLGAVALALLFTLLGGLLTPVGDLADKSNQFQVIGAHAPAILFSGLVGVMLVTTEFRYGTIRPTLLFEPRRERVVAAKVVAALLGGAAIGLVVEGIALGVGSLILHERGVPFAYTGGGLVHLALGTVATAALWCAIGAGLGAVVRHQVGAIIGLLAWLLVAENLLFGLAPSVGRFAPGPAGQALAGDTARHLVAAGAGAALLVGYALVLAVAGATITLRRDVE
jgi:ABC-type transport system involved in multi-copper enzyme maturation permease subunit